MAASRKPKCLIAAGGTAGHVLPAIAVAEALAARGADVSFAGTPDHIEARLVPAAGFELDTFKVEGFPRRPTRTSGSRTDSRDRLQRGCSSRFRLRGSRATSTASWAARFRHAHARRNRT